MLRHAWLHHDELILRQRGVLDDADFALTFGHFQFGDIRLCHQVDQGLEFS